MVQHRQKERRRDSARRSSRRINPPGDALQDGVVGPRGDVAFHTPAVPYLKQFLLCLEVRVLNVDFLCRLEISRLRLSLSLCVSFFHSSVHLLA